MDLIIETVPITPKMMVALCAAREESELICDRCQDPDEIVVAAMLILPLIEEPLALCGSCARELPSGFRVV